MSGYPSGADRVAILPPSPGSEGADATTELLQGCIRGDVDARRRLVDRWSYGAATAPRQLFRLLRSLTLLAYFESEAVRAVLARDTSIPAIPVSPPSGPR